MGFGLNDTGLSWIHYRVWAYLCSAVDFDTVLNPKVSMLIQAAPQNFQKVHFWFTGTELWEEKLLETP